MSFRLQLCLLIAVLLGGVLLIQWFLMQYLNSFFHHEASRIALKVGEDTVRIINEYHHEGPFEDQGVHDVEEDTRRIKASNIDVEILLSDIDENKQKELITQMQKITDVDKQSDKTVNPSGEEIVTLDRKAQLIEKLIEYGIHISNGEKENFKGAGDGFKKFKFFINESDSGQSSQFIVLDGPESEHRIEIPNFDSLPQIRSIQNRFFMISIGIFIVILLLAVYMVHRLTRPMKSLQQASQQLGGGELGIQIEHNDKFMQKEISLLINAFNAMSMDLKHLQTTNEKLKKREHLSELGEVARGLAHTVRNPLNTLGLCVETLGNNQKNNHKLVHTARQQIDIIDNWVRSFLSFSEGAINLNEMINIKHLCQELVLEASCDPDKKVHSRISCLMAEPLVRGSPSELRTILQALIVNAVQASFNEGELLITIKELDNRHISLIIVDQGEGLSPDIRTQLFQPHITNKTHGAGMGLYLAKRILETRYDGGISLKDNAPQGTIADVIIATQRAG